MSIQGLDRIDERDLRPTLSLRSSEFRKSREASWRELEALVRQVETKGISKLRADELQALPLLYRTASSSLSVARAIALDRNLILYLENLALRAYFIVYGPRTGFFENLGGFLHRGFPAAVRSCGWHILLASAAIILGGIAGFFLVLASEDWFSVLMPDSMSAGRGPKSTAENLLQDEIFAPWPGFVQSFVVFANTLFRHNATIGIMAFGLGIVAGVPTLLLMAYQGLLLGAFIALHYNRGLTVDFIGWITIHGVTELGAIVLCGAAGLLIAEKIIFPEQYSRIDSLATAGKRAASMAGGAVLMLFAAGLIEGGFRQLVSSTPGRFAFGLATAILWLLYFLRCGKERSNGPEA